MHVFSLMGQKVYLVSKIAVQNVGCVFAYFCGGHKNNFPLWLWDSYEAINFFHDFIAFNPRESKRQTRVKFSFIAIVLGRM